MISYQPHDVVCCTAWQHGTTERNGTIGGRDIVIGQHLGSKRSEIVLFSFGNNCEYLISYGLYIVISYKRHILSSRECNVTASIGYK